MKIRTLAKVFAAGLIASSMAAALPVSVSADTLDTAVTQSAPTIRIAKVKAVSGSSITVAFGEEPKFDKMPAFAENGQFPAPPTDENAAEGNRPAKRERPSFAENGELPAPPTGENVTEGVRPAKGERPAFAEGDIPADLPQKKDMEINFTETGETAVVDLSGVTIIKDGKAAAVSDISEGDVITIVYNNGAVTEIRAGHPGMRGMKGGKGFRKAGKKGCAVQGDSTVNTAAANA